MWWTPRRCLRGSGPRTCHSSRCSVPMRLEPPARRCRQWRMPRARRSSPSFTGRNRRQGWSATDEPKRAKVTVMAVPALDILVCEDDWMIRTNMLEMLQEAGHRPTGAPSGQHALDVLETEKVD